MAIATDLRARVIATIDRRELIPAGSRVLLALSGGADSVVLFHILQELASSRDFTLMCAHVNHGIRGTAADSDENFVRELCFRYNTPLFIKHEDIPARAKRDGVTLEQAGRLCRYVFFDECGADVIATAHHADDQAESILMHLIRGSGLTGLCGMNYRRGNIIHPLLDVRRAEIERFAAINDFDYVTDKTNFEPDAARNKVRLYIVPYVTDNLNFRFVDTLCAMAGHLREDEAFLTDLATKALDAAAKEHGYDRESLLELPSPIRARALRIAMFRAGAVADIEDTHVTAVTELLCKKTGARLDLPYITAYNVYDVICFEKKRARHIVAAPAAFNPYTAVKLAFGSDCILLARMTGNDYSSDAAYLDLDKLPDTLTLRTRRAGDTFKPLGAPGTKKLKDFFIDRKIPREQRECPLICSEHTVIALLLVDSCFVSDEYAVRCETKRVLRLNLKKSPPKDDLQP